MPTSLILTEGDADDVFFGELIRVRQINDLEVVRPGKAEAYGWTGFQKRLEGLKLRRGITDIKAIVVVVDCDDNPEARFREIAQQVSAAGDYSVPTSPGVFSPRVHYPPVAILLIPGAGQPGCLDTLCYTSAASMRPAVDVCVGQFVDCIGAAGWPISSLSKLRLRCLLSAACPQDPNTPLKHAWKTSNGRRPADLIPLTNSCFDGISSYLAQL